MGGKRLTVGVIGGGASGLVAAITAARNGARVVIYERGDRVGKKILSTGNGRCNLTNINADETHYYGKNRRFTKGALMRYGVKSTIDFFSELGVLTKTEDEGKVYPYSGQASSVLDALRFEADRVGVEVIAEFEAVSINKTKNGFKLKSRDGRQAECDRVIIATGGKAAPKTGSDGNGYELVKRLGHTVTPVYPALVQIKTETEFVKPLKGIKTDANVSIIKNGKCVREEFGELLFTDYGISGPPVFKLSVEVCGEKNVSAQIDLMPEYSVEQVTELLRQRKRKDITLENYLSGMINKRLGQTILKRVGVMPLSRSSDSISNAELTKISESIKRLTLRIDGTMSWANAQSTMGGVNVSEINPSTMESKLVDGMYIIGELLDVCGDCGGYNLQWAWSSGIAAGNAACVK